MTTTYKLVAFSRNVGSVGISINETIDIFSESETDCKI